MNAWFYVFFNNNNGYLKYCLHLFCQPFLYDTVFLVQYDMYVYNLIVFVIDLIIFRARTRFCGDCCGKCTVSMYLHNNVSDLA